MLNESVRVLIEDSTQTGEARRIAKSMAGDLGFDAKKIEEAAIVVTEACTNVLKHAKSGEVLLRVAVAGGNPCMEIIALDCGPGMANVNACFRDGYSSGLSPGNGLGAISRLSSTCDVYSQVGSGTALLARIEPAHLHRNGKHAVRVPPVSTGVVHVAKPHEQVCGDSWGVEEAGDRWLVMVADGLGHGPEAATASTTAISVFRNHTASSPKVILGFVHDALRSTRGAAVAVAELNTASAVLTFAGIGNISGVIHTSGESARHLVSVNGTVGHEVRRIQEFSYPWSPQSPVIFHSDGLSTRWKLDDYPGLCSREPSLIAAVLYRDFCRHTDDATILAVKYEP